MAKSDYEYKVYNDFLLIIDLNLGNMSVTNNIESVLEEINYLGFNLNQKYIIARDSDNKYDRILYRANKFRGWTKIEIDEIVELLFCEEDDEGTIKNNG